MVDGQIVLELVNTADMRPRVLRPRAGDDIAGYWWVAPDRLMDTEGLHVGGIDRPVPSGELFTVKADGTGAALLFGFRAGGAAGESHTATLIKKQTADMASGELIAPLHDDPLHALIASYGWYGPGHSAASLGVHPEVFRIDVRDGKKTLVTTAPLRDAQFLADHKGGVRFAFGVDTDQFRKVWYRDAQGGDWGLLHDEGKQHDRFVPLMFDRSDMAVYVTCDSAYGIGGVCRWDTATRKQEVLWSASDSAVVQLLPTADGLDGFAVRSMPGRPAVTLLDKNAPEAALLVSMMKQLPGEDVVPTSASYDGRDGFCTPMSIPGCSICTTRTTRRRSNCSRAGPGSSRSRWRARSRSRSRRATDSCCMATSRGRTAWNRRSSCRRSCWFTAGRMASATPGISSPTCNCSPRAAMRCCRSTTAALAAMVTRSRAPVTASGAARCRTM